MGNVELAKSSGRLRLQKFAGQFHSPRSSATATTERVLNYIWLGFLIVAVLVGGFTGKLPALTKGAFDAAETAVMKIALPLVGIMAIWLEIMRLAERAGLVQFIARALRPVTRRLFPDVPRTIRPWVRW
jgi:hypothetical protein